MERHNRSREKYIASYIMFAKSLQWGDRDDLVVDVDDEHAGGGWSPPEVIPTAFPPSDVLRRQPSVSCFVVFVFLRRPLPNAVGGLFLYSFLGQDEGTGTKIDGIGGSSPRIGGPTRSRNLTTWAHLFRPSGFR